MRMAFGRNSDVVELAVVKGDGYRNPSGGEASDVLVRFVLGDFAVIDLRAPICGDGQGLVPLCLGHVISPPCEKW